MGEVKFINLKHHGRKGVQISVRFGFVGAGLMGCRVCNTVAQLTKDGKQFYPTLGININSGDLEAQKFLKNKLLLPSNHKAAGRDPYIGSRVICENETTIKRHIAEIAHQSDFVWFVAGLGGGTGTGAILHFVDWGKELRSVGVDFGLIVSIPRENDGYTENRNALLVLQQLNDLSARRALPLIVIDNDVLFKRYLEKKNGMPGKEFTEHANEEVVGLLHQLNIITNYSPFASKHFDGEEFRNVIARGGCIQFSKIVINPNDFSDSLALKKKLQDGLENGAVGSGYDFVNSAMIGVSVFAPSMDIARKVFDAANVRMLEEVVKEIAPRAESRWGQYLDPLSHGSIEIYFVVSGLGLPGRIEEIPVFVERAQPMNTISRLNLDFQFKDIEKADDYSVINPFGKREDNSNNPGLTKNEARIPEWLKKR